MFRPVGVLRDAYRVLNLTKGAKLEEVQGRYRELAKKFHPDRYKGGDSRFKEINHAYQEILRDMDLGSNASRASRAEGFTDPGWGASYGGEGGGGGFASAPPFYAPRNSGTSPRELLATFASIALFILLVLGLLRAHDEDILRRRQAAALSRRRNLANDINDEHPPGKPVPTTASRKAHQSGDSSSTVTTASSTSSHGSDYSSVEASPSAASSPATPEPTEPSSPMFSSSSSWSSSSSFSTSSSSSPSSSTASSREERYSRSVPAVELVSVPQTMPLPRSRPAAKLSPTSAPRPNSRTTKKPSSGSAAAGRRGPEVTRVSGPLPPLVPEAPLGG
eukprot:RCo004038